MYKCLHYTFTHHTIVSIRVTKVLIMTLHITHGTLGSGTSICHMKALLSYNRTNSMYKEFGLVKIVKDSGFGNGPDTDLYFTKDYNGFLLLLNRDLVDQQYLASDAVKTLSRVSRLIEAIFLLSPVRHMAGLITYWLSRLTKYPLDSKLPGLFTANRFMHEVSTELMEQANEVLRDAAIVELKAKQLGLNGGAGHTFAASRLLILRDTLQWAVDHHEVINGTHFVKHNRKARETLMSIMADVKLDTQDILKYGDLLTTEWFTLQRHCPPIDRIEYVSVLDFNRADEVVNHV